MTKHLYDLVKSMSKAEKRGFKIYATSTHDKNKYYLDLFDHIVKMKAFSQDQIDDYLKQQIPSLARGQVKKYLFDKVLQYLRSQEIIYDIERLIEMHLQDAEILLKRQINSMAIKSIQKAGKLIEKHKIERLYLRYNIIYLRYAHNVGFKDISVEKHQMILNDLIWHKEAFDRYINVLSYNSTLTYSLLKNNGSEYIQEIGDIENEDNWLVSKVNYYYSKALYYESIKDYKQTFEYSRKCLELFDKELEFKLAHINLYVLIFNINVKIRLYTKQLSGLLEENEKIKELKIHNQLKRTGYLLDKYYIQNKMQILIFSGEYGKLIEMEEDVKKYVNGLDEKKHQRSIKTIYYGLSVGFYVEENFDKASLYADAFFRFVDRKRRNWSMYKLVLLIYVTAHGFLGNFRLLAFQLKNKELDLKSNGVYDDYIKNVFTILKLKISEKQHDTKVSYKIAPLAEELDRIDEKNHYKKITDLILRWAK